MDSPVSEEQLDQVREIIRNHRGIDNAITSGEINEMVGIEPTDGSQSQTRRTLRYLVLEEDLLIGSHAVRGGGYFLIETDIELLDYMDELQKKINGIMERMEAVQKLYRGESIDDDEVPL